MNKTLLAATTLLAVNSLAQAGISVSSPAFSYSQSFDALTTATAAQPWANNSTLAGWSLFVSNGNAAPTLLGGTGSSNAGSFFSFGAAGVAERALGSVASGGTYFGSPAAGAVAGYFALAFTNDSGGALAAFSLGFDGEQWRDGGAATPVAQTLVMEHGFGASFAGVTSWQSPGNSFNFTSPVLTNTASGAAVNGNVAGLVTGLGGNVAVGWMPGETLWLRWVEVNNAGNDHGLAIDNLSFSFSVTAVPEPGTVVLWLAGLGAIGFVARRRG